MCGANISASFYQVVSADDVTTKHLSICESHIPLISQTICHFINAFNISKMYLFNLCPSFKCFHFSTKFSS